PAGLRCLIWMCMVSQCPNLTTTGPIARRDGRLLRLGHRPGWLSHSERHAERLLPGSACTGRCLPSEQEVPMLSPGSSRFGSLLLLLAAFAAPAAGQTSQAYVINGTVVDEATQRPLASVSVTVSGTQFGTLSDQ